ncbi:MAG TPA: leucyl aminopeptidase family protein [Bacteroidales bacterium]|mgnify:FL=1|jgi:leucyl aminopeptidase|nr:MAG: Cytosol aminopeptidase [Bacteroidetes bacterium ADurb.Bin145]HOU02827.1 leucyl aminopeptidase family protein [Bacteroidales bacterium]HQG63792.1 leucyl aminopeptidase family protein [Bacteroidales bacterium]HQK67800.1 leucyl aminopeptidase family protein [Bacteroidales bacterium]
MMKPEILKITQISPDQSVVCIIGKAEIPEMLKLTKTEKEYALGQLKADEEYVFINSYFKCTYIVKVKDEKSHFRTREELRKTASGLKKLIKSNNHSELVITSYKAYKEAVEDFTEGLILGMYVFDKYKTKTDKADEKKSYPSKLLLLDGITKAEVKWLTDLTDAVYFTRDLINEPVNVLNAGALASEVEKIGRKGGFKVDVLRKGKIEALKMGGLLAVNKGSVDPPVFCILEWNPANKLNKKPIVLVGKGIVYDTGGLNIKTDNYMALMKGDMAGAAAVTGVFYTAAKNKIPLHIMGFLPVTDNRPGGNAYTQGDILTMHNGMTVEIGNTDAEGRLILADAISYASRYKPELIINIATLTGSAASTFSNQAIAMMTNADRKYISLLEECGHNVHERVAELPFWDDYAEMIKSEFADVRNIGGREAGAITAGKFLEKFTAFPLIHLDIAGTGLLKKDDHYRLKDGPASGLRLLAAFLKKYAENYNKLN